MCFWNLHFVIVLPVALTYFYSDFVSEFVSVCDKGLCGERKGLVEV
jgi:hypothetical protein